MRKKDSKFLSERRTMAYALQRIINNCELCFSKVKNGFTTKQEAREVENMITRIDGECSILLADIKDELGE